MGGALAHPNKFRNIFQESISIITPVYKIHSQDENQLEPCKNYTNFVLLSSEGCRTILLL